MTEDTTSPSRTEALYLLGEATRRTLRVDEYDKIRTAIEAEAVAPDAGLRARHSLPDGRLHDADTCPDENHAGDLHDLFAAHPAPQWVEACVDPGHHE